MENLAGCRQHVAAQSDPTRQAVRISSVRELSRDGDDRSRAARRRPQRRAHHSRAVTAAELGRHARELDVREGQPGAAVGYPRRVIVRIASQAPSLDWLACSSATTSSSVSSARLVWLAVVGGHEMYRSLAVMAVVGAAMAPQPLDVARNGRVREVGLRRRIGSWSCGRGRVTRVTRRLARRLLSGDSCVAPVMSPRTSPPSQARTRRTLRDVAQGRPCRGRRRHRSTRQREERSLESSAANDARPLKRLSVARATSHRATAKTVGPCDTVPWQCCVHGAAVLSPR